MSTKNKATHVWVMEISTDWGKTWHPTLSVGLTKKSIELSRTDKHCGYRERCSKYVRQP